MPCYLAGFFLANFAKNLSFTLPTMPRGSQTLFAEIFESTPGVAEQRKGRSADLHKKRNECLIDRYYFYGKFEEKRYSIILETLSHEFFISVVTIPDVISENVAQLQVLKREKPTEHYFKKKWPHLVW